MKWVKTLVLNNKGSLEKRIENILLYIFEAASCVVCKISNIDATGKLGNGLTILLNEIDEINIEPDKLIELVREEGQIFDMNLTIANGCTFKIIVSRGDIVDVIGNSNCDIPASVLGDYVDNDISLFNR